MVVNTRIVTLQARQAGTQTYKTTCFPFRKAGGFLCLLRLLPQALANNTCSGTRSGGLRLRDQRSLTIERQGRRPSGQRSVIFFKLGKQRSYVISIEVIKECFVGFLCQFLLQFCFRSDFIESIYVINVENKKRSHIHRSFPLHSISWKATPSCPWRRRTGFGNWS